MCDGLCYLSKSSEEFIGDFYTVIEVLSDAKKQLLDDNSTQSIGAIWITQLRHFRPFDLELVATDCSRPDPYIHWFL